jgi:hypothetical protein
MKVKGEMWGRVTEEIRKELAAKLEKIQELAPESIIVETSVGEVELVLQARTDFAIKYFARSRFAFLTILIGLTKSECWYSPETPPISISLELEA